jgi:Heparinase II/III-like protein
LLIAALESALGSDFGLSLAPGFSETGAYPAIVYGPSGQYFNYADGHAGRSPEPILFWFAARYHRPDWLIGERKLWSDQLAQQAPVGKSTEFMPLALLWMQESTEPRKVELPLDWSVGGGVPISVHRSSWSDSRATFVGVKAGSASASHGHMDIGSFVFDSDGVRWATDLGSENYYGIESRKIDLWNTKQNSERWTIFRLSNLGHNTLVIDDQLQEVAGNAKIVGFSDDPAKSYSIVDLTSVYRHQADSIRRGVALMPDGEVVIQDQLTGLRPGSRVRWQMITTGTPDDLGKSALTLHQKGEQLILTLLAPDRAVWSLIDTAKPRHEWDSPNPGTRMITFETSAPKSGRVTLAVVATPGTCGFPIASKANIEPLETWGRKP